MASSPAEHPDQGQDQPTIVSPTAGSAQPPATGTTPEQPTVLGWGAASAPTVGSPLPPDPAAAETITDPLVGTQLGDFRLDGILGRGGMGAVYRGRQLSLDRPVAIKVLPPHLAHDDGFRGRFQVEAKAVAKLASPHVVQVYGAGVDRGLHWFAMEHVEGQDLGQLIKRQGRLSHQQALDFLTQAAKGLAAAGDLGIVHRDIKPSNMMVTPKGVLKLMDFGLARVGGGSSAGERLTLTGTVMGTVSYFSPEQGRGESCDHRTDLYALGVVFYELLTGRLPFQGEDPTSVIYQHIHVSPKSPREIDPTIPEDFQAVCLKCMQKDAADRYSTAHELLEDLDRLRRGLAPDIDANELNRLREGTTLSVPAIRPQSRRLMVAAVAGGVVLVAVAGAFAVHRLGASSGGSSTTAALAQQGSTPTIANEVQELVERGRFAEARARLARSRADSPGDVGLLSLGQVIDAAEGSAGLAAARATLAQGDVDSAAARVAAARPLLPGDQDLAALEQEISRRQETADRALARSAKALEAGDLGAAEVALVEVEKANPKHRQLASAQEQLTAARAEAERKQKLAASKVARAEQALAGNDLEQARTLFKEALEVLPGDPSAAQGIERVERAERQRTSLAQELDTAIAAGDLATAEARLGELRPLAAGTDLGRTAEQRVADLRARKDDEKRAAEAQERAQVAIAARIQARLDDLDESLPTLEQQVADFASQYPGRPEITDLQRRLGDRQARRQVETRLSVLDAAVRGGDGATITAVVSDQDFAGRLGSLANYRGLRFNTRLGTFARRGTEKASATLAIRHALSVFPERTLTYDCDLELVAGSWVVTAVRPAER